MNNNINIAEILRDCPQGMKLYSPVCGECTLKSVDDDPKFPITVYITEDLPFYFTADGRYIYNQPDAECVLFPSKDQRDWSKFHRPFVDGDIVITNHNKHAFIYSGENNDYWECYCGVYCGSRNICITSKQWSSKRHKLRLATEEEKQKLFQVIKDNGYKWNEETKTLEKLVEPKFKVEDKVWNKNNHNVVFTITSIEEDSYVCGAKTAFWISDQDNYELVPNKFDINTLKPFDKVLVRDHNCIMWCASIFSHTWKDKCFCVDTWHNQCIPYKGNEHLLGITDDCDEYYKTWE